MSDKRNIARRPEWNNCLNESVNTRVDGRHNYVPTDRSNTQWEPCSIDCTRRQRYPRARGYAQCPRSLHREYLVEYLYEYKRRRNERCARVSDSTSTRVAQIQKA